MTQPKRPDRRREAVLVSTIIAGVLITSTAATHADESRAIRGAARRILSSREFRHLKPLKRARGAPRFDRSAGQPGSGNEGEGADGKPGNDGADPKRGQDGAGEDGRGQNEGPGDNPDQFGEGGDNWQPGRGDGGRGGNFDSGNESESSQSARSAPTRGAFGQVIGGIFQVIGWIFVAIVVGIMVFLVVKGILGLIEWYRNGERKLVDDSESEPAPEVMGEIEPESAPGELPADVYVSKARELAHSGKYREAVAQLLLGAMSHIERGGFIKYRKGLTHRDYARAVRSQAEMYGSMKAMVRVYEPLGFGRREATREHFEQSLSGYQAGFRATHPTQ